MPTFASPDGIALAYRVAGTGDPLVCLAGGMADSAYLEDLGGLDAHRQLVTSDLRGTGDSDPPDDTSTYRCEALVDDVEALRIELGLDRIDLLAHSGAANIALMYAARYPDRVRRLALITPSVFAIGLTITPELRIETAELRDGEPWFPVAYKALQSIVQGQGTSEDWAALGPFFSGRWDADAERRHTEIDAQTNHEAAQIFASDSAFDPPALRSTIATLDAPVLIVAGAVDLGFPAALGPEFAALFPDATLVVQPRAGHFPWRDDPAAFVEAVRAFLG